MEMRPAAALLPVVFAGGVLAAAVPGPGATASASAERDSRRTESVLRRHGLVRVRSRAPTVQLDIRYATRSNFTGRRLPGYCRPPFAFLRRAPARALGAVQRDLRGRGLGLRVFDAYRPARASRAMVRWARRSGNGHLLNGYIASRSRHNEGRAVDLTLVRLRSGRALDMGVAFDTFSSRAHTANARGRVLRNRRLLVRAMARRGFRNYHREWWHYEYGSPARRLDVPLGCPRRR